MEEGPDSRRGGGRGESQGRREAGIGSGSPGRAGRGAGKRSVPRSGAEERESNGRESRVSRRGREERQAI